MQHSIIERNTGTWNFRLLDTPADRSGFTIGDLCRERGFTWEEGNGLQGDLAVFKAGSRENFFLDFLLAGIYSLQRRFARNSMLIIGEPRYKSRAYYLSADPKRTLAVAPGKEFKRLILAQVWKDPQLVSWPNRLDRMVWFGAPYPERVALAQKVISWGIPLDIYAREPWPLANYCGPSDDEYETSLRYKYRLAAENCCDHLYHSEKLFQSERAGCLTFYHGDPNLDLSHAEGSFLWLDENNIRNREKLAEHILAEQSNFLWGSGWEYYSYRRMFNDILDMASSLCFK